MVRQSASERKKQQRARERAQMPPEEQRNRRQQDAQRMAAHRQQLSPEEQEQQRQQLAQRMAAHRQQLSPAEYEQQRQQDAQRKATYRQQNSVTCSEQHQKNRASFSLEKIQTNMHFDQFEDYPEAGVILYHLNSGHGKFDELNDVITSSNETGHIDSDKLESVVKEVQEEQLSPEELEALIKKFQTLQGRNFNTFASDTTKKLDVLGHTLDSHHIFCGLCGMRHIQGRYGRQYKSVLISELPSCLCLGEQEKIDYLTVKEKPPLKLPTNEDGELGEFHLYKLMSVYHSTSLETYFHLHPESVVLMDNVEHTILCHNCNEWLKDPSKHDTPPENSIASGIDFGDARRIDLEPTTLMEDVVLSRYRLYHNVVNIHNNLPVRRGDRVDGTKCQIRASCVIFPTSSPNVASASLLSKIMQSNGQWEEVCLELQEMLTFHLVGAEGDMDFLLKNMQMSPLLKCRPWVLFQRLAVYQNLHPQYKDDLCLPDATFSQFLSFLHSMATKLEQFNKAVASFVTKVTDQTSIDADRYECDDIAQVRTHVVTQTLPSQPSRLDSDFVDTNIELSYTLLSKSPLMNVCGGEETSNTSMRVYLKEVAEAFGVKVPDKTGNKEWEIGREEVPVNEFTSMDILLPGTFPDVFLLGKSYPKSSLPNKSQIRHLLLQFTNKAATNRQLLFYLFDTQARHDVVHNFVTKIRTDPTAWEKFARLATSEEFLQKVSTAAADPKSNTKVTRDVLRTVLPVLSFGTRRSVPGSLTDPSGISRAYAQHRRYGHGTLLYTLTPDDKNNPNFIRLSKPLTNNICFPATVNDSFYSALQTGKDYVDMPTGINFPMNYTARHQASLSNPVAVALEFQALTENVIQILIGCPLDFQAGTNSGQKKTTYFRSSDLNNAHHKGIFGYTTALSGCIETQARGALHIHIIVYGGLKPKLLEDCVGFKPLCEVVSSVLDSMYTASMPLSAHIENFLLTKMKHHETGKKLLPPLCSSYASMFHVPSPTTNPSGWLQLLLMNMFRTAIHRHTFTCRKHAAGKLRCRGAFPCTCVPNTGPIELLLPQCWEHMDTCNNTSAKKTLPISQIVPEQSSEPIDVKPDPRKRDYHCNLLPVNDDKMIVWELKRPIQPTLPPIEPNNFDIETAIHNITTMLQDTEFADETMEDETVFNSSKNISQWLMALKPKEVMSLYKDLQAQLPTMNGWVVSTNPTAHNLTGSSNNAIMLGNEVQGKASFFYVLNYLQKDKVKLQASLISLEQAAKQVQKHKSIAADSGTVKRTAQHMFTKVVNDMTRSVQVSDTQVALCLLNTGAEVNSDSFGFFGASFNTNYFLHQCKSYITSSLEKRSEESSHCSESSLDEDEVLQEAIECDSTNNLLEELPPDLFASPEDGDKRSSHWSTSHDVIQEMIECEIPENLLPDLPLSTAKSFGPAPFYKSSHPNKGKISIPVHYPTHYWFRGEALKCLTAFEYAAIVEVIPIHQIPKHEASPGTFHNKGRPKRKTYEFHPKHPLFQSHVQVLRSKQNTLIVNGHTPKYPGTKPSLEDDSQQTQYQRDEYNRQFLKWQKKAEKFAHFCLANFMPHEEYYGDRFREDKTYLSFDAFASRIERMESSRYLIDRMRVSAMSTYLLGFKSNSKTDKLLDNFRHRSTTRWTEQEKKEADSIHRSMGVISKFQESMDGTTECELESFMQIFSTARIKSMSIQRTFASEQLKSLSKLHTSDLSSLHEALMGCPYDWDIDTTSLSEKISAIDNGFVEPSPTTNTLQRSDSYQLITMRTKGEAYIKNRKLSKSQASIVKNVFRYFCEIREKGREQVEPPTNLLTGEPGSGKSYVIETLCELAKLMNMGIVATTSYNGIAAVNVDGNTIQKMFSLPKDPDRERETLTNDKLALLQQKLNVQNMCMLIVDEISTIDTKIIAVLNLRLQQLFENNLEFGGIPVIFAGDFNQLGPVLKDFIPTTMMLYALRQMKTETFRKRKTPLNPMPVPKRRKTDVNQCFKEIKKILYTSKKEKKAHDQLMKKVNNFSPNSMSYKGAYLLSKFKRFHLSEQQRSNGDEQHTKVITKFDKGESITEEDMKIYNPLTAEDVAEDPSWLFAPVLVSTNHERMNITREKAKLWATKHNTHVYKWKTKIKRHINPATPNKMESIMESNSFFWQYFVKGAPAFLSETINGELALVNGTPITMHSMTLANQDEHERVNKLLYGENPLQYGQEVAIEQPLCIYVEVNETMDGKELTAKRSAQLQKLRTLSCAGDKIVIPMMPRKWTKGPKSYNYYNHATQQPYSSVGVNDVFAFQLAFAMTVHKAQGRTIDKVVIDLHDQPTVGSRLAFEGVFVAISRVRSRKNLRLLPHGNTFEKAYGYITKLRPSPQVTAFYRGFEVDENSPEDGLCWNYKKALGKLMHEGSG